MFNGFNQQTIEFMWNLRLNNEKTWFEAHKNDFQKYFQNPMKDLAREVYEQITADYGKYGLIHKVSRIYKDARRVRGGEPYRTNLWFSIEKPSEEWTSTPVFWFDLSPETWSYGLGYYQAKALTIAKLRARIDRDPKAFEKLIAALSKQDEFVLEGSDYARKKTAPSAKTAEWYNKKSFSLIHQQTNGEELFSAELVNRIVSGYRFLMPFYDYFITLDNDPTPGGET